MTQLNLFVNSLPRDLLEFAFFIAVGFTAGSVGLIWFSKNRINILKWFSQKLTQFSYKKLNIKF